MKRSARLRFIAVLLTLSGVALAAVWSYVCLSVGAILYANGPWLIALLCAVLGGAFALASVWAEWREREASRGRYRAATGGQSRVVR